MEIPLISENILDTLFNQLESGFDSDAKSYADKRAKKGMYAMELHLGIDEEGSYRSGIFNWWLGNKFLVSHLSLKEKIIQWSGTILFPLLPLGIIILLGTTANKIEGLGGYLLLILAMLCLLALVVISTLIPTRLFIRKYKSAGKEAAAQLDPWELFECSYEKATLSLDISLGKICSKLGVDPEEAKIGLGKATGGGSTYVGWGSGRAVGAGIGLSAISSMRARSQNSTTNSNIKELENYLYYNNVAAYFNSEIA